MGHVTWITILFGSIPEAFFIFLIAKTVISIDTSIEELALMSGISSVICYMILNYFNVIFGIHSLCIILAYSTILKLFKKINIIYSLLSIIFGWMISALIQYINMIGIYLLGLNYSDLAKNEVLKMLYFSPSIVIFAIVAILIHKKNIVIYNFGMRKNSVQNKYWIVIVSFIFNCITCILFNVYISMCKSTTWDLEKKFTILTIIILILSIFIMIFIIVCFFKEKLRKEYEDMLIEKNLDDVKKNIKILKKQRHDYLRHMQIVYSLLDDNKYDDAKDYIESLTEHINNEGIYIETGNTFLNSVISLKQEQSKHRKIELKITVKNKVNEIRIPNFELCNIVSNIIDNAFDALDESEINNKSVELIICEDELCYIFKIKNNGNEIVNANRIFEEGFSTKKGKNRGYGLHIVKQTLEKYRSSIFIKSKKDITEFSIVIPKY